MGAGIHGGFGNTYGAAFGSADYMKPNDTFSKYIKNRSDVDVDGFYDIIAHGNEYTIEVQHNGQAIQIDHRTAAKLLSRDKNYKQQGIRLLSCSTGKIDNGFAQNLANKLGVPVKAPTDILWVKSSGNYYVKAGKVINGHLYEDGSKVGKFKTFYPNKRDK